LPSAISRLHVLVDAFGLEDGSQDRGIGTYLRSLLVGLGDLHDVDVRATASVSAALPPQVRAVPAPLYPPARSYRLQRSLRLPRLIARSGVDMFHSPAQEPPRSCPVPWVQTLHDLTPFIIDDPILRADRRRWQRIGPRLRSAGAVICPSTSSADQAMRFLAIDARRIEVIPHGVDLSFTAAGPRTDLSWPYLLWVSAWGPHKGFEEACRLVARLAEEGLPHRLVTSGRKHPFAVKQMRRAAEASGHPERVELLGYVDDIASLYRGASALIVTSRAEGFGLPVLEAFACGTPVVAFDNTSLPEVVGDAGLLVADGDVEALASAVREVLTDPASAADLARAGVARAAHFTWKRAVAAHCGVYRAAASGA
jgi:glycosyltransferase involved in cell wall biosynthesis